MVRLFNEERIKELAEMFAVKLAVFSETGTPYVALRPDTENSLRKLIAAAKSAGATRLNYKILSIRASIRNLSNAVLVEWRYCGEELTPVAIGEVTYFFGPDTDRETRILMVKYVQTAFSEALTDMPEAESGAKRLH